MGKTTEISLKVLSSLHSVPQNAVSVCLWGSKQGHLTGGSEVWGSWNPGSLSLAPSHGACTQGRKGHLFSAKSHCPEHSIQRTNLPRECVVSITSTQRWYLILNCPHIWSRLSETTPVTQQCAFSKGEKEGTQKSREKWGVQLFDLGLEKRIIFEIQERY